MQFNQNVATIFCLGSYGRSNLQLTELVMESSLSTLSVILGREYMVDLNPDLDIHSKVTLALILYSEH